MKPDLLVMSGGKIDKKFRGRTKIPRCFTGPFLLLLLSISNSFTSAQSPGGVSTNLKLWLKADQGVTPSTQSANITAWNDQSGGNNHAAFLSTMLFAFNPTSTTPINPVYQQNSVNFNPAVLFNGTSSSVFSGLQGSFSSNVTSDNISAYIVFKMNSNTASFGRAFVISQPVVSGSMNSDENNNLGAAILLRLGTNASVLSYRNNTALPATGLGLNLTQYVMSSSHFISDQNRINLNGADYTPTAFTNANFNSAIYRLGVGCHFSDDFWNGNIAEVILYQADQSTTVDEDTRIQSYLALKYGINSAGFYLSSGGTIIWNATANAGYLNSVFGIGRDDGSSLNQIKSNSVNTGSGDGTGQSGMGNIILTAVSLANNDFIIMGHNNGALTFSSTDVPAALGSSFRRTQRVWKSHRTNFAAGNFTLEFDLTGLGLINIADPGSFKLLADPTESGVFNGGSVIVVDPTSVTATTATFNLTPANFPGTTFSFATTLQVLPIKIISFTGSKISAGNQLQWQIAEEQNISYFEIEYGSDGRNFSVVGTVAATGNTGTTTNYSFTHSPVNGAAMYRLKMIDNDGQFTYSRVIRVNNELPAGLHLEKISPIPFISEIAININSDKARVVQLIITDMQGRNQSQQKMQIQKGSGIYSIQALSSLTSGTYLLSIITDDGNRIVQKMQK